MKKEFLKAKYPFNNGNTVFTLVYIASFTSNLLTTNLLPYLLKPGTNQKDPKPVKPSRNELKQLKASRNDPKRNCKTTRSNLNFKIAEI